MKISKKDFFFLILTFATVLSAVVLIYSKYPTPFDPNLPASISLLYTLSGWIGIFYIYLASMGFLGFTFGMAYLVLPFASFIIILFFTDGMHIGKRIAYAYFISMYLTIIQMFLVILL